MFRCFCLNLHVVHCYMHQSFEEMTHQHIFFVGGVSLNNYSHTEDKPKL